MRVALALTALLTVACGDNVPAPELVVVAHQDDDLLFMQPDIYNVVRGRLPVTVVYVTAGDGGNGLDYTRARYTSAQFAYGAVAGSQSWSCRWTTIEGHAAKRCSLDDRPVTLIFLGYPDGGISGSFSSSLLHLWRGDIASATTIAEQPTSYTREELITTVASIIEATSPRTIRTLEIAGTHGYDHSDHMMVGALTQVALARTARQPDFIAYRGYNITNEPVNLTDEQYEQSSLFMRAYNACMTNCGGECGVRPCDKIEDSWYDAFLHRNYAVGMQEPSAGVLSSPAGCIGVTSDDATVVSCATAPDFELNDEGFVRVGDGCLTVDADNTLSVGECEPDPRRFFQLDDEGHLWTGVVAQGMSTGLFDHSSCVYIDENHHVTAGVCGADNDWRWTLR